MKPKLNSEQSAAVEAIAEFLKGSAPMFVLSGSAGTGKTFCMQHLLERVRGKFAFTAPTNKATRVLADTMKGHKNPPLCRTIYSLLGLRLAANGEVKELTEPDEYVDLSDFAAVVVDEASMVNTKLFAFIQRAADSGTQFIFLGDPAQLPPVGEVASPIWTLPDAACAKLETVMRHDNQILTFVTKIRDDMAQPFRRLRLTSDNDGEQGVWAHSQQRFMATLRDRAGTDAFLKPGKAKAIAWRNVAVAELNTLIRKEIFGEAASAHWLVGDRCVLTAPASDLEGKPLASTDEEGTVESLSVGAHSVHGEFDVWRVSLLTDGNQRINLEFLHESDERAWQRRVAEMAAEARASPRLWKDYWTFVESFHQAKHAYALTAHRSQGSTYDEAFVWVSDILRNSDRLEAFKCLYVAASRPRRALHLA